MDCHGWEGEEGGDGEEGGSEGGGVVGTGELTVQMGKGRRGENSEPWGGHSRSAAGPGRRFTWVGGDRPAVENFGPIHLLAALCGNRQPGSVSCRSQFKKNKNKKKACIHAVWPNLTPIPEKR